MASSSSIQDGPSLAHRLGAVAELAGLEPPILDAIAAALEPVPPGDSPLAAEGHPQDRVFFVLRGAIARAKHGVAIDSVEAPRVCGLLHAFRGDANFATLRAAAGSDVFALPSAALRALLRAHPALSLHLLAHLAERLRSESRWQRERLAAPSALRVAFFDAKQYDRDSFEQLLPELNARAPDGLQLQPVWLQQRLSAETASLAAGCQCACVFVNDVACEGALQALARLGVRMLALRCAGYDGVDLRAAVAYGLPVVRVPAYSPEAVAEHAAALMLCLARKIHTAAVRTRDGNFSLQGLTGRDVHGRVVGVVGTGKIGRCFARIAAGMGAEVLVADVQRDEAWAASVGARYVALGELLAAADVVSVHCPLLPSTRHLVSRESIAGMKDGVMILNTSRGAIVDTAALLEGLASGKVGAAGLDVYENERPYFFQDHSGGELQDATLARLANMRNVILTGHQAYLTHDALRQIAAVTLQNITDYFWLHKQQPLQNQVLDEWSKASKL